jgi:hypothetical protein
MPGIADSQEKTIDLLQRIDLPQDIARRMAEAMERTMNEPEEVETHETGETIGSCVTHWLNTLRSRVDFKKLSPHRYSSYDNIMARFRRWAGEDTPIIKLQCITSILVSHINLMRPVTRI